MPLKSPVQLARSVASVRGAAVSVVSVWVRAGSKAMTATRAARTPTSRGACRSSAGMCGNHDMTRFRRIGREKRRSKPSRGIAQSLQCRHTLVVFTAATVKTAAAFAVSDRRYAPADYLKSLRPPPVDVRGERALRPGRFRVELLQTSRFCREGRHHGPHAVYQCPDPRPHRGQAPCRRGAG